MQKSPGQLVFGRDMILNIKHQANWEYIRKRKQSRINDNNEKENAKQIPHEYQLGNQVLIRKGTEYKYEQPYEGPYPILQIHDNGTVKIQKGAVTQTVNLSRVTPYVTEDAFHQGGGCSMHHSKRQQTIRKN